MSAPKPYQTGGLGYEGLATVTPKAQIVEISPDDIAIPATMRPIDTDAVNSLVQSIGELGLQASGVVTIRWAPAGSLQRAILVAGRHRLEAFKALGWVMVPATVFEGDETEAEVWRLSENFTRLELSALERAEVLARLKELRERKTAQDAQVSPGGRGRRGGNSELARDLGIDRRAIQRGAHISGLSAEAKTAAIRLGLDDNALALIEAAGAGGAAEQVDSLERYAARHQPPTAEQRRMRIEKTNRIWQNLTDWSDAAARFLVEELGKERALLFVQMVDKISLPEIAPCLVLDHVRALLRVET